jgi:hypothetical protein
MCQGWCALPAAVCVPPPCPPPVLPAVRKALVMEQMNRVLSQKQADGYQVRPAAAPRAALHAWLPAPFSRMFILLV